MHNAVYSPPFYCTRSPIGFLYETCLCAKSNHRTFFGSNSVAVTLALVFAVVIGVASALVAALVVVLCKCLWVWWRFHKTHRGRSLTQETYFVHQKGKWPTGITYQTYENCSVADSLSSGEEPYIIETPGDFGKLQFSVEYSTEEKVITIGLVQAKGIICQTNIQTAFLYAVVQLCKDEKIVDQREIEKQKMTFGPQWNEELFFSSGENPIETLALRIQLMELDSFSTSHLIGQVVLSLDEGEFNETHPKWYDIMPGSTEVSVTAVFWSALSLLFACDGS